MKLNDILPGSFDTAALWQVTVSVSAILAGALIFWWLLMRAARRTRHHYETLMSLAQQSRDAESELATAQRRLTALRLVVNATKYFLAISTLFLVLQQVGIRFDSLLLPAGFLGAALGLGAQNMVRDVVSGLFLVFEGQFGVGDIVSINGTLGTVEEVGLRVTRLRDDSGQIFYFPNGGITTVSKYPKRTLPLLLWIPLAPKVDIETADKIAREVLTAFDQNFANSIGEIRLLSRPNRIVQPDTGVVEPVETGQDSSETVAPSGAPDAGVDWTCWQFTAHPARAATLREKVPGRLASALQAAEVATGTGAAIEIIAAPVEVL